MILAFPPADISGAITALYAKANMGMFDAEQPVTPLSDLVGAFSTLATREISDLTLGGVYADRRLPFPGSEMEKTEELAGFLFASPLSAIIYINRTHPSVRRRFTVGHELGHCLLHFLPAFEQAAQKGMSSFDLVEAFSQTDTEEQAGTRSRAWIKPIGEDALPLLPPLEQMEAEADQFAAELLMPAPTVKALTERYRKTHPDKDATCKNKDLIRRVAAEMLVSRAAMQRRFNDLNLAGAGEE